MTQFYSPYQPGGDWNAMVQGIVQQAVQQALASQQASAQADQRSAQGGPVRRLLGGLATGQMPGSLFARLFGGQQQTTQPFNQYAPPANQPAPGKQYEMEANRGVLGRMPQRAGNNQYNKWNPAQMQWGNPMLGYYQPPSWKGWNSTINSPYNPLGGNYGGTTANMNRQSDDLFKRGR